MKRLLGWMAQVEGGWRGALALLMAVSAFLWAFAPGGALANDDEPPKDILNEKIYLPLMFSGTQLFTVSGQVLDADQNPLAGAVVADSSGATAVSGADGQYALQVPAGPHALAPELTGYQFTPAMTELTVSSNVSGQDFTAMQACSEAFQNGGLETTAWWVLPNTEWPAAYSNVIVHSGARSVRTGILNQADNRYGYSSLRSPAINVPAATSSAILRLWLYPISSEAADILPEAPEGPLFGNATNAYDAQYVVVLDGANNNLLETLLWVRSNNQMWTYHEFNLSKWAGRSIKVQVGTYNDGADGVTAMYVDDLSLQLCAGTPPVPPPLPTCANYLSNSGFEYNGAWGIPVTEYPAGYSSDYAYAGWRSMRTGVPLYSSIDKYSYSDAWQDVSIPADATSAVLRMEMLPRSQEPALALDETGTTVGGMPEPEAGTVWGEDVLSEDALSGDAQYVLILDPWTGVIRKTLLWQQNANAGSWQYGEASLMEFRGQTIRIQFGTYNNGNYLRSVMYVDEAYVDICSGGAPTTPPTPPPTTCSERVLNGGFESTSAWSIPITEFSAGYSTFLRRSGLRSMRSGIYYPVHNRYSYSDFRQAVTIPAGASQASLSFYTYAISGEVYANDTVIPEKPTAEEFGTVAMSGDVQYLLLLDYYGNWINTLVWRRSNEQYWRNWQFDLRPYAGATIQLQFGTYNNGWGGVTAQYVDDVSLWVCP